MREVLKTAPMPFPAAHQGLLVLAPTVVAAEPYFSVAAAVLLSQSLWRDNEVNGFDDAKAVADVVLLAVDTSFRLKSGANGAKLAHVATLLAFVYTFHARQRRVFGADRRRWDDLDGCVVSAGKMLNLEGKGNEVVADYVLTAVDGICTYRRDLLSLGDAVAAWRQAKLALHRAGYKTTTGGNP